MKIAVTYDNGDVFGHFGHTKQFKIYNVENGVIQSSAVVSTNGSGHGALVGFLVSHGVDTLICGGIGGGAKTALAEAKIKLYGGTQGSTDNVVNDLLSGNLNYDVNVHCDHHDKEHGDETHTCGEHGCGGNCTH